MKAGTKCLHGCMAPNVTYGKRARSSREACRPDNAPAKRWCRDPCSHWLIVSGFVAVDDASAEARVIENRGRP